MTRDELQRIIEEEIRKALVPDPAAPEPKEGSAAPGGDPPASPTPPAARGGRPRRPNVARWLAEAEAERAAALPPSEPAAPAPPSPTPEPRAAGNLEAPANPEQLARLISSTPSRLGVGRAGVRYLTGTYVGLRADHAIAKDAVYSEAPDALIASLGCLALRTRCKDREDFLLYPAHGRRLDDASLARLKAEGTRGADVQVIVADGLSAWAAERNGPELLPLLQAELAREGWTVGRPLFVRFARVGVQDEIGTALGNKATVICLGERPGLGTGDSLSLYLAFAPKLDQDNAEKNCISNVRAAGIRPSEAARGAVDILRRAFAAGKGGIAL